MPNKYLTRFFRAACAAVLLTSCGGSSVGGTGEFATVYATVNTTTSGLDSDVATWLDAATETVKAPPCLPTSAPTVTPDDVPFIVTSTAYTQPAGSTTPVVSSALSITSITLNFTPANSTTPALPPLYQTQYPSAGQSIIVGINNITIRVVSDDMKVFLQPALLCTGLTYSYRVTVSLVAQEATTGKSGTINLPGYLLVNLSDFIDK